jgi:putative membrane protein (TIGR04086 family)
LVKEDVMNDTGKIHWVRAVFGGFLAEVLVIALVIPIALKFGQEPLLYVAPIASLISCFLFGLWVARGVESRFVLHGLLVGVVATLIYVALTKGKPEPRRTPPRTL